MAVDFFDMAPAALAPQNGLMEPGLSGSFHFDKHIDWLDFKGFLDHCLANGACFGFISIPEDKYIVLSDQILALDMDEPLILPDDRAITSITIKISNWDALTEEQRAAICNPPPAPDPVPLMVM